MTTISLRTARLRLDVRPDIGGGCAGLWVNAGAVNAGDAGADWRRAWVSMAGAREPGWFNDLGCYLLAPWSNRVAGAAFPFEGRDVTLRADWPDGTAIHGVVKDRAWRVLDRSPFSARLLFESDEYAGLNWRWRFRAVARYEVADEDVPAPGGATAAQHWRAALACDLEITNTDDRPMPAGGGWHPFFARTLWPGSADVRVRIPGARRYPCTNMLPTGPAARDEVSALLDAGGSLGTTFLDDVFVCDASRPMVLEWAGPPGASGGVGGDGGVRCEIERSPECGHAVVYAPVEQEAGGPARLGALVCVEPVSMVNDGFRLHARGEPGTGVVVLRPGETLALRAVFRFSGEG